MLDSKRIYLGLQDAKSMDYNEICFEHFFPDLSGKVTLLDEYFNDEQCQLYHTVKHNRIKFHDDSQANKEYLVVIVLNNSFTWIGYVINILKKYFSL